MAIPICLSELYFKKSSTYISQSVSYNFLKNMDINITILAPVGNNHKDIPSSENSIVENTNFVELPYFNSIKSFALNYYFNNKFKTQINKIFYTQISKSNIVWARNPSFASIIFSELALKENKILISHICADIEFSWKNPKYKGIQKVFAYIMSKVLLYKLKKISKHKNTYSLCTGSKIFNQFKGLNSNTKLFVDSLIKQNELKDKNLIGNNFLFVGRLNIEKGILDLIDACIILNKRNVDFTLDIIGFGSLESEIKELINNYNLNKHINFVGSLPYKDVLKYYQKNSIFILPTNADYEGFPRVILEAWSYGMPVITTDVGGIKGLGKNNKNLIFVDRKDSNSIAKGMEQVIKSSTLKREMQNYIKSHRNDITFEYQKNIVLDIINDNKNKVNK